MYEVYRYKNICLLAEMHLLSFRTDTRVKKEASVGNYIFLIRVAML